MVNAPAAIAIAVTATIISAMALQLKFITPRVSYHSAGWTHECAKWDEDNNRFLVSTLFDGGVGEVSAAGGEEKVFIPSGGDVGGLRTVGIHVDRPRQRLLVCYTGEHRAALAAYDLHSSERLFLTPLIPGPEDGPSLANDVTVDFDGNAFVTDSKGNKIWAVTADGALVSTIRNETFTAKKGPRWFDVGGLNGIVHHPIGGYLLVVHTSGGRLFKVYPKTGEVRPVGGVDGRLQLSDGLLLLSPTRLVAAGVVTRVIETDDDWESARTVERFVGLVHRLPTTATLKDGKVYVTHMFGFGFPGKKKTHIIAELFSI